MNIRRRIETIQTSELLKSIKILINVRETRRDLLSLQTSVKKSQEIKMITKMQWNSKMRNGFVYAEI